MAEIAGEGSPTPIRMTKPVPPENPEVVYAPDTVQGKLKSAANAIGATYRRYFKGENPVVKTTPESQEPPKV